MTDIFGIALGPAIVIAIRLIVPLTIFRWPLLGAIASMVVDLLDVVMITIIGQGDFSNYFKIDKALDWYFLLFLVFMARLWVPLERNVAYVLFAWRTIGVVLIETVGVRELLFVFPNLFLLYWLFNQAHVRYYPHWSPNLKQILGILLILLIPKLFQEYMLHIAQVNPWNMTKEFLGL